ncbi:MAG: copper amine oxidase N-terminal domain-containing protein [Oscillospiraceae bacterium]
MRKKGKTIALFLILSICLASFAFAAPAEEARAEFTAEKPDSSGVFALNFTISNASFNAFQFAVRFNPSVVQPLDASGKTAASFGAFATKTQPWLSTVGCSLNAETGFVGFTGYISPGETASLIKDGEAHIGSEGVRFFSFRFKKIGAGAPDFKIATQALGEPYEHAFPEGAGIIGSAGKSKGSVVFDLAAMDAGSSTGDLNPPTVPTKPTAEALLEKSLILKIDSHALVANSGVTAFYPGETKVVPQIDASGRTLVPLRFISEKLGAKVAWEGEKQTAVITSNGKTIRMTIGDSFFLVDGVKCEMDTAAKLVESAPGYVRTLVPLRFVAEALGKTVAWNPELRFVIIAPGDYTWDVNGVVEKELLGKANSLLIMYSSFV